MKRILVIEDDDSVRGLIAETLRLRDWEVLLAPDGAEGIATAFREIPDLILCDIQMPEKDGFEVLKELRLSPALATTPFVFLTGMSEKPRVRHAMELGADDYLVKPFTIKELLAAVEARFKKEELIDQKIGLLRENLSSALPHELVTPLNSILGFSSLILDTASSDDIKEFAALIRGAGERLQALIEKFLFYAKVEISAADPEQRSLFTRGPKAETADVIIGASERAAQHFQRRSDLHLSAASAEHYIHPAHLARLVQELAENGFKFSERGQPVEVRATLENGSFSITVTDRGRGLSAEQVRKVGAHLQFDRHLQEQQGAGLGLAICRRIAQLYGGSLDIQSTPGERTCVQVRLPA
jgi:two-component system, sensor histidine kinase and response regulator